MNTTNKATQVLGYLTKQTKDEWTFRAILGDADGNRITFHHLTLCAGFFAYHDQFGVGFVDLTGSPEPMTEAEANQRKSWRDCYASAFVAEVLTRKPLSGPQRRASQNWDRGVYLLNCDETAGLGVAQKVWPQATRVGRWREKPSGGEVWIGELSVRHNDPTFPVFGRQNDIPF